MRRWMRFVPAVVLTLPLLLPSVSAAGDAELNADKIKKLEDEVRQLRRDLNELRDVLRKIDSHMATISRESYYGPAGIVPGAVPMTATVTLENRYSMPATVRLNGRSYRLEPGQISAVPNMPIAPFNYEVDVAGFGLITPLTTENLRPTGHRIVIYPR